MPDRVTIDEMAQTIMDGLLEYADLATDEMKKCVKDAGNTVKKEIKKGAPVDSGRYRDSWTVTKQKENSASLELVIHSKTRYQLAHLLEHGHAKRGGGRVAGKEHIAPAEELGEKELLENIERRLGK